MTPQELRQSIYRMAFEGKLVNQISSEGTGDELYKLLQKEKRKMLNLKFFKAEYIKIDINDTPFDIPNNWKWSNILECGYFISGYTPKNNQLVNCGEIPYFKVSDMNTFGNELFLHITNSYLINSSNPKVFLKNTIVYPKNGGALLTNKKRILSQNSVVDLNTGGYTIFEPISLMFVYYYFLTIDFKKYYKGTALPTLDMEKIKKIMIPLPPLDEQKRIVARIEELMPLVDKYEEVWNKLEKLNKQFPIDLEKSILQYAMEGKLVEQRLEEGTAEELKKIGIEEEKKELLDFGIPVNWAAVKLGNLIEIISGVSYDKKDISNSGVRILRGGNIQQGRIILGIDDVFLPMKYYNSIQEVKKSDIVIVASTGSKTVIGKPGFSDNGLEKTMIGAFLRIIRPKIKEQYDYLKLVFLSKMYRNHISNCSKGTNINNIKSDYINDFVIPLPPLEEQKRIVSKIEELLPLCESLTR